ncbi:MAG: tRNA1(Val) (adenine(37)-N6)-methyltransferase [Lepagella sp.]
MRESLFHFKKFSCHHGLGSIKIGVDAVLIGAWANVSHVEHALDVGTGCGVIALMLAQRNDTALIDAIDIDADAIGQANQNFKESPWSDRLKASLERYNDILLKQYDLIISNPPYFDSGITHPDSSRLVARHQSELSPWELLRHGVELLADNGRIALIIPADQMGELVEAAKEIGLNLWRCTRVKGHADAPIKRALLEFGKSPTATPEETLLTLETAPGQPTEEYRRLCKDFYLKF